MIRDDYEIDRKPITSRNPQANAILERIHATIGNIIRTFDFDEEDDERKAFADILSATMFSLRATVHTTLKYSPMQLVFGRDAIFNIKHVINWPEIVARKQEVINQNNQRENDKRIPYQYRIGQKILIKSKTRKNKFDPEWKGPARITRIYDNGTVRYQLRATSDIINIRNIHPYKE